MTTLPGPRPEPNTRPVCTQCMGELQFDIATARWLHLDPERDHEPVMSMVQILQPAPHVNGLIPEETPDAYLAAHEEGIDQFYGSLDAAPLAVQFDAIRSAHLKLHEDAGCQLKHCPYAPCPNPICDLCHPARTI